MHSQDEPIHPAKQLVNDSLLTRESWKIFQVMAELVEGFERLVKIRPAVSIFGSARSAPESSHYKLAKDVGRALSDAGFNVVTGGGPGIMEAANIGAQEGKSLSIGLNIELPHAEGANAFQDISLRFRHFFTRKVMFVKYANAYVVCPGGFGTLDEIAEILALIQTEKTRKIPIVLVNHAFWKDLLSWFENTLLPEDMIDKSDLELFHVVETPEEVVGVIQEHYQDKSFYPSDVDHQKMEGL